MKSCEIYGMKKLSSEELDSASAKNEFLKKGEYTLLRIEEENEDDEEDKKRLKKQE